MRRVTIHVIRGVTGTREFHRGPITGPFHLAAGEHRSIPFQLHIPWELPITEVYGQHLHGMSMGVRTELEVAGAADDSWNNENY